MNEPLNLIAGKSEAPNYSRRQALGLLGGGLVTALSGCCELRGFPKPQIKGALPARAAMSSAEATFLAPTTINTLGVPTLTCVDVHAHFFNASDVTVKGYLEGPVAYSKPGVLGDLLRLLAPLGDALAEMAPTAQCEYDALQALSSQRMDSAALRSRVLQERQQERHSLSVEFNRLVQSPKGKQFREAYARAMQPTARSMLELRPRIRTMDDDSVLRAMTSAEEPIEAERLRSFAASDQSPYGEGILAFVGYMLSSRRSNLLTHQSAFTESAGTIGVRRALGLLVDFDHWLACPPRSAHEDQMKLHLKLAALSNHHLLPVISYNPWTDVINRGQSLDLVVQAIQSGFVAVKIYPPNGFRPWGNTSLPEPHAAPSGAQIDAAMKSLWLKCQELQVPVIAHAARSMGRDASHNLMAEPGSWQSLIDAPFWPSADGPRVSLGHFGGDSADDGNDWTQRFAQIMGQPRGRRIYADLAYWQQLQCATVGQPLCQAAENRLSAVLNLPVGNTEVVADRVMYGSDWLMLSMEKNWPAYAQQLHASIRNIAAPYVSKIFGENAQKCFGAGLQLAAE